MKLFKKTYLIILIFALFAFNKITSQVLQKEVINDKTIKIGLLIADSNFENATFAAQIAIDEANKKGGLKSVPFQLVTKSMEGSWGTGSKQTVDLVFIDNVWGIIGSLDGRNAHLVEQVIAKTHIVFLSAWATDPSLSQSFVPWYFSCVPNSNQETTTLIDEIYNNKKLTKIAIVLDAGYDSKINTDSFISELKTKKKQQPIQYLLNSNNTNINQIIAQIKKGGEQGVLLFANAANASNFINILHQKLKNLPVFSNETLLKNDAFQDIHSLNLNSVTIISNCYTNNQLFINFKNIYFKKYGKYPGAAAQYSYDTTNLMIEAIKKSWSNRDKMQQVVSEMHFEGITGSFYFNERGNRVGEIGVVKIN